MKKFEIREFGIDKLQLVDCEMPAPAFGQVLIRMTAASLNYRDLMVVEGKYNPKLRRHMIPLSDGAGVVEEIGPGVTRFKPGDRVTTCFFERWVDGEITREKGATALGGALDGVLREYVVLSEEGLVRSPQSLSDVESATLPCAALTAWHALFEEDGHCPGQTVLLQGTGGVSVFALQFARTAGLRAIITSSSDQKLQHAVSLGASETINYKANPKWDEQARALTGGIGVDQVIEVGGSDTLPKSLRAVRTGGTISVIGVLSGVDPAVSPTSIMMNSVRVQGIYVGSRAMFERMNRAIEFHRVKPVVNRVFPWTQFPDALRYMQGQQHFGKICLQF
jgi:NADPH:quinone reductase-like Zn-dependent oxidoreductase